MDERKIYYSFHEIPQQEYRGYPYQKPSIRFSQTELYQILIAMAVLTVAFSFALSHYPPTAHIGEVITNLPKSFIAIITAFLFHELAHKFVAQKYGYWSEFRMYLQGLLFALLLGVMVGIVFAAPGAVVIAGRPSREESGRISIAGPLTNIVIAIIAIPLWFIGGLIGEMAYFISLINAFLALFNLLPFGPLDGRKVFRWNKGIFGLVIAIAACLLIFTIYYP